MEIPAKARSSNRGCPTGNRTSDVKSSKDPPVQDSQARGAARVLLDCKHVKQKGAAVAPW